MTRRLHHTAALCAAALALAGCASVAPDGLRGDVAQLTQARLPGGADLPAHDAHAHGEQLAQIDAWLAQPLTDDTAVRIALLNNPGLHAQLAGLAAQDAERAQALTLLNPRLTLGRFTNAHEREIERQIGFSLVNFITLPWRTRWQGWRVEQASLRTAQAVLDLAADTRRDWLRAVAARQNLQVAERMHEAAAGGGELARRMARIGNFSAMQQARELATEQQSAAQLARARLDADLAREALARRLGLWGTQATALQLPDRLPELPAPAALHTGEAAEATALRERLDLRALRRELDTRADEGGWAGTGAVFGDIGLAYSHDTQRDRASGHTERTRGWELDLPLPLFDWGGSAGAGARAGVQRSAAQLREAAIRARSEARTGWLRYRTAWELAHQQQTQAVPLAQFMQDEAVLRYNGMFIGVWDLLAQARATAQAVAAATDAQRDFWLANVDLQQALNAPSTQPGADAGGIAPPPAEGRLGGGPRDGETSMAPAPAPAPAPMPAARPHPSPPPEGEGKKTEHAEHMHSIKPSPLIEKRQQPDTHHNHHQGH